MPDPDQITTDDPTNTFCGGRGISVLVLTLDEEVNISECLRSVPWKTDIHVLDSFSQDKTREIAESHGAKIHQRAFDTYAKQRNHGLRLPFQNDWILMLDADERLTPELVTEIEAAVGELPSDVDMMIVRRKDIFMGRWLRRSSGYPTWFPRLLRKGKVTVNRAINETYEARGGVHELNGHLLHYPFKKGLNWWYERHNRYSDMESALLASADFDKLSVLKSLLSARKLERRKALKRMLYSLPLRPFIVFLYLYVIRMGFLDGKPGYLFAMMRMSYEVMIDAKLDAGSGAEFDLRSEQKEEPDRPGLCGEVNSNSSNRGKHKLSDFQDAHAFNETHGPSG